MMKAIKLFLICLLAGARFSAYGAEEEVRTVRVGIFQVEPLNFTNATGKADGLNPDLLREISGQLNRWQPVFVPVTWAEGLAQLQSEQIDVMMSVTKTLERTKVMDYSTVPVLEVWGQVYVLRGSGIESTYDLESCSIGLVKADIHGKNFIRLADAYGINYDIVEYGSHREVLAAVAAGEVMAGVVPSHFGLRQSTRYAVVGTPIQFSPAPIYFAVKKGLNADVIADIDSVMMSWKEDENSYYYKRFSYWFARNLSWNESVPVWLKVVVVITLATTLLLLFLSWLLKHQVKMRTLELSESEERYRLIVENQSDLVVKVDKAGRFSYVSPSYCDVFGKTEEELIGNKFLPLVHEDDHASTEQEFMKIFTPPHTAYIEQRALTRHGWRWFSWHDSAILDEEGLVQDIIGIGRDITARKEAEEASRKSSERLELATRAGQVGIWEYELSEDKLIWDDQMFKIYDVERSTFSGKLEAWEQTLHPDDLESARAIFRKAIESGHTFETEFRVIGQSRQVKHIRALADLERDEQGNPVRAIGMNWDVSAQRQMVAALTASERDYRQLFENMTTGFLQLEVMTNAAGSPSAFRIVQVNEAGCSMTRLSRNQLIGHTLSEVFHPLEEQWFDVLSKVAITGKASAYENRIEALDLVLSAWIFVPKPGFIALVVSDNTARRMAEDAVLRAQQQLEHIVNNTKDVIWQIDLQGNYIYANVSAEALTGYKMDQILKMNVLQLITTDFHEMAKTRLKNRIAGNPDEEDYSFTIRCADGSVKWLELSTNEVYGNDGELEAIQGVARDITVRKKAERELEESRQFLRNILDMIPVGVFWKDIDLNYLGGNKTFFNALGYSEMEEIIGKDDFSINEDGALAETYQAVDRQVLATGESLFNYDNTLKGKDGTVYDLLSSKMPLRNVDGEIVGVLGAYVDMTEQKAAEQKLEESRHFLRSIIDTIPARVFWKDKDSVYLGCNLAFAEDSGVGRPEDLVGKSDYDMSWSTEEADLYRQDDAEVMASGIERVDCEEPQTRSDGSIFWLSTSKVPIRDRAGQIIGVLGAYQDITDRKILEGERIRLSAAINQSAEAIVITDEHGMIQYVNPAFEEVTGFSVEEALGTNLSIMKSNRHDDRFYDALWEKVRSGQSWNGRIINRHKNGTYYTSEAAFSPVKDSQNRIVNYVAAVRDVSRQVELEEHMRQAQKMDAVGRLAGGVAHDFNNILQSILGFSGILLAEMEAGTPQYEDVSEIRKAARRAGDLTRQLLTLSRKHNVEYAVLDLNSIIRSNEKMMSRLIGERVQFEFDFDPDLKPVLADLSQIEQIILNLFINARDAMPEGGALRVKTFNVSEPSGNQEEVADTFTQVCLEVSDSGCGIRDDVREHLFEPFFTTKRVGEGTGLGLSVVYGIVQQHGGRIEVKSKVGEGAVFSVFLPVCDLNRTEEPEEDQNGTFALSLEGHNETVLVVEDDTVVRELTDRMLGDAGYSVVAVGSMKEAQTELERGKIDFLLADVVLPDGNGLDFARNSREYGHFPVLLCSGYSHGPEMYEAMQVNGFRYLEKPVGSMQLLQTVREMLDESRSV
ncbi:PAS domain S-box protein [Pontiellaceae bacterium B12227]|nr:PAS domain S-box protein [Pontiellaceae bacterium B12227]